MVWVVLISTIEVGSLIDAIYDASMSQSIELLFYNGSANGLFRVRCQTIIRNDAD